MTAIANQVSGASTELVEEVLAEYGDPDSEPMGAENGSKANDQSGGGSSTAELADNDGGTTPYATPGERTTTADSESIETSASSSRARSTVSGETESDSSSDTAHLRSQLSQEQLETLRVIQRRPEATQVEIAAELGVSRATVSNRVNDVEGFDWQNRNELVDVVIEDSTSDNAGGCTPIEDDDIVDEDQPSPTYVADESDDIAAQIDRIGARLDEIENVIENDSSGATEEPTLVIEDPDLIYSVVRAIIGDGELTEAEERQFLLAVL
ncbi:MarR family transcriptional regulator [Halomicrobium urmianum]|uniref:MarR family transcriptional regulator n=1 Tax=Halomicrobium urmianum TaxID=1586233 RepID=UPI001CDA1E2F|nr:helix-turn-helix domain-containing protein [Halomicrobium urmianum]